MSAAPGAGPPGGHHLIPHCGMITVSIMLATIMQALDTTIANVALPHMQGALQSSQDQISWVLTSYIVAAAIATPLTGWLCSAFGRRRVFLAAVLGFTAASALCGMALNIGEIVGARLLQGVFGAALVPLSQAVLLDINPKEKVAQAMAIWGAGIMIGPILGPMLGGWLTEDASWRWVFYINLPVGALAFYGIVRFLPESRMRNVRLDVFGFATLSLTIGLLQMFLDRGEQLDWFSSLEIRAEAIGCAIAFALFLAHTFTAAPPSFFDRRLLKDTNFVAGLLLAFTVGLVLYATMALLPNLLQGLLNYPVVYTGMVMAPRGVGTMAAMLMVGRLLKSFDPRSIMALGFSLTAVALYMMTRMTLDMDGAVVTLSGVIQGLGIGFTFVPLSAVTFATLAPELRNDGTPIYSLLRNIGSSVGISIVQAMLTSGIAEAHAQLAVDINAANPVVQALPQLLNPGTASGLGLLDAEVTRQAAMMAYLVDFRFMLALTLLSMPLLLLIRKNGAAGGKGGAAEEAIGLAHEA